MNMMRTLEIPSGFECSVLKEKDLPEASNTGRFATFSKSAFEGSLFETSMSPLKSPVGPSGLDGLMVMVMVG